MKPLINFKKLIITIWILLWAILFMLVIGKVLFHQWYPIVINNQRVLDICNFIDNYVILRQIIAMFFYCLNGVMIFYITTKQRKYNYIWTPMIIALCVISDYVKHENKIIGTVCELIIAVIISTLYNIKSNKFSVLISILYPIIINIILALWQLNILFIRDIKEVSNSMPTLIITLLQTDYYIFLIITWIGVVYIMGVWGFWFFGKPLTELKAMKEKELAKENPDKEFLAKLEQEITRREEA